METTNVSPSLKEKSLFLSLLTPNNTSLSPDEAAYLDRIGSEIDCLQIALPKGLTTKDRIIGVSPVTVLNSGDFWQDVSLLPGIEKLKPVFAAKGLSTIKIIRLWETRASMFKDDFSWMPKTHRQTLVRVNLIATTRLQELLRMKEKYGL